MLFTIVEDSQEPNIKPTEIDQIAPKIAQWVSKSLINDTKGFEYL